jgi:hypothetical protein
LLWELREHEGWRAYRWELAAVALMVGVWVPPVVGGVAATFIVAGGSLLAITAGTMVTLALGAFGTSWFGRRPWRMMLEKRVAAYWHESDALDYAMALIGVEDFGRAPRNARKDSCATLHARCNQAPPAPASPTPPAPPASCKSASAKRPATPTTPCATTSQTTRSARTTPPPPSSSPRSF